MNMSQSRKRSNPVTEAIYYCEKACDKQGLESRFVSDEIGRGVFATLPFSKGDFLLQYVGEMISIKEARKREVLYENEKKGCFLFFVEKICFDATRDDKRLGRLVNDGIGEEQNSTMRTIRNKGSMYLCLFASRDITIDEELRYDYGVSGLPWRKPVKVQTKTDRVMLKKSYVVLEKYEGPNTICLTMKSSGPSQEYCRTEYKKGRLVSAGSMHESQSVVSTSASIQLESSNQVSTQLVAVPTESTQSETIPTESTKPEAIHTMTTQGEAMPTMTTQGKCIPTVSNQSEAIPTESTQPEAIPIESSHPDAIPTVSTQEEAIPTESTEPDTIFTESPQPVATLTVSTQPEAIPTESTQPEAIPTESTQPEAIPTESTVPEAIPTESTQPEAIHTESTQPEAIHTVNTQREAIPTESTQEEAILTESTQPEAILTESTQHEATPTVSSQTEAIPTESTQCEAISTVFNKPEALPTDSYQFEAIPRASTQFDAIYTQSEAITISANSHVITTQISGQGTITFECEPQQTEALDLSQPWLRSGNLLQMGPNSSGLPSYTCGNWNYAYESQWRNLSYYQSEMYRRNDSYNHQGFFPRYMYANTTQPQSAADLLQRNGRSSSSFSPSAVNVHIDEQPTNQRCSPIIDVENVSIIGSDCDSNMIMQKCTTSSTESDEGLPVMHDNESHNFMSPLTESEEILIPSIIQTEYQQPNTSRADYQQPSTIHADYQQPSTSRADYQQPSTSHADYQQTSTSHADYQQPSTSHADYQQPSTSLADYQQPSTSHAEYQQPSTSHADYQQPSTSHADYQQPNTSRAEYQQPSTSHADYQQPSTSHADYQQPSTSQSDCQQPNTSRAEYQQTSTSDADYQQPSISHQKKCQQPLKAKTQNPSTSNDAIQGMKFTAYPNVVVPRFIGERDRDNSIRHRCFYCSNMCLKMSLHLKVHHCNETDVAKALTMETTEKSRELDRIRLMGDFNHNIEVLRVGQGTLIVPRKSPNQRVVEDYLPCLHCLAFMVKTEFSRHMKNCRFQTPVSDNESSVSRKRKLASQQTQSRTLMQGALVSDDTILNNEAIIRIRDVVVNSMHHGQIRTYVGKDPLILKYGTILFDRLGVGRKNVVSQRMRQLARLVIEVETATKKKTNLMELIDGSRFDDVVSATRKICGENTQNKSAMGVQLFKTPSYGLHIGHSLARCALIKRGVALRKKDLEGQREAETFKELHAAEWTDCISSRALQTLKERKYNSVELLPLTSDLMILRDHLEDRIQAGVVLMEKPSPAAWTELSRALYCALTLFNKRRGGETAKMSTEAFTQRPKWRLLANKEIKDSLSALEKRLANQLDMVQLPGKRGRRVCLLIKPQWIDAMKLLVNTRTECHVQSQYFFAVPHALGHLAGWKVLRKAALAANCDMPHLISSTKLRKYIATVTQVLNLKEGEIEWLGNHLGHTLNIHREAYRLHESTVELAKVSKILLAVDQGQMAKFHGMSLDDVAVDDVDANLDDDDDENEEEEDPDEEPESDIEDDREDKPTGDHEALLDRDEFDDEQEEEEEEEEECSRPEGLPPQKRKVQVSKNVSNMTFKSRKLTPKMRWSDAELNAIRIGFGTYINEKKKVPGKSDVEQVLQQFPLLQKRTVPQIKSKIQHLIKQTNNTAL